MKQPIEEVEMEICPKCMDGTVYKFDFNKRCCRARHSLMMPQHAREAKLAVMREKCGEEWTIQHMRDINTLKKAKGEKEREGQCR